MVGVIAEIARFGNGNRYKRLGRLTDEQGDPETPFAFGMRNLKELLRAFLRNLARLLGLHRRKPANSNHGDPERQQPDDVDDDDISDDNGPPTCGCGRVLKQGWACPDCRTYCPQCGRALAVDEPCDRCAPPKQQQQQQRR